MIKSYWRTDEVGDYELLCTYYSGISFVNLGYYKRFQKCHWISQFCRRSPNVLGHFAYKYAFECVLSVRQVPLTGDEGSRVGKGRQFESYLLSYSAGECATYFKMYVKGILTVCKRIIS